MKAQELIEDALVELGIIVAAGTVPPNDLAWGKRKLNRFLGTISADKLNINVFTKENFSLVSGTGSYTIGSGGDFDTVRPISFNTAFIRISGHDFLVAVRPIHEYWNLADKTVSNRPVNMYYDPIITKGVIYFDYVPDAIYDFHFTTTKPFIQYDDIVNEDVLIPEEHKEMVISNLAVRMASKYGRTISEDLRKTARDSLDAIRGVNLANTMKGKNFGGGQGYDIDGDA